MPSLVLLYRHHDAWWWAGHHAKTVGNGYWERREITPRQVRCRLGSDDPYDRRDFTVRKGHRHFRTWAKIIAKEQAFGLKQTKVCLRFTLAPIPTDYLTPEPREYYVQDGKSLYRLVPMAELDRYPDKPIDEHQRYHSHP